MCDLEQEALARMTAAGVEWIEARAGGLDTLAPAARIDQARTDFRRAERKRRRDAKRDAKRA